MVALRADTADVLAAASKSTGAVAVVAMMADAAAALAAASKWIGAAAVVALRAAGRVAAVAATTAAVVLSSALSSLK